MDWGSEWGQHRIAIGGEEKESLSGLFGPFHTISLISSVCSLTVYFYKLPFVVFLISASQEL